MKTTIGLVIRAMALGALLVTPGCLAVDGDVFVEDEQCTLSGEYCEYDDGESLWYDEYAADHEPGGIGSDGHRVNGGIGSDGHHVNGGIGSDGHHVNGGIGSDGHHVNGGIGSDGHKGTTTSQLVPGGIGSDG